MVKRDRSVKVTFWVTPEERAQIQAKMDTIGVTNMSAYLRKLAIDGYALRLDFPELHELLSLLRRYSNNLNQLTRRVHGTGRIYDADLADLQQAQESLLATTDRILEKLNSIT
ncbi:MAG: plasmid mobilization relaxosome protein MobC [Oscillospiraceae bacterium]|nr:plasmid mobilization relaxosome protein MobC [Oscillospiraceae bacterium]